MIGQLGASTLSFEKKGGTQQARRLLHFLVLLSILAACGAAVAAEVRYIYDELGRLVGVVAANGESAQYSYDKAGNITAIQRANATALVFSEFTPNAGPTGSIVTLHGSGFVATPAGNTVKFNGVTATVTAATANTLTVVVPSGATTGKISVTNANGSVLSGEVFTVASLAMPTITGFMPAMGHVGTAVTIHGGGFHAAQQSNKVLFGSIAANVATATATSLATQVPSANAWGKISVTTPHGIAQSSADFFALPSDVAVADVGFTGRVFANGSTLAVATASEGKKALILFDAQKGQSLGLGVAPLVTGAPGGSVSVTIYTPNGNAWTTSCWEFGPNGGNCNMHLAPLTGTYAIRLDGDAKIAMTLTLSTIVNGALTINGPNETFTTTRVGQDALYTFAANAGQNLSLVWQGGTVPPLTLIAVHLPGSSGSAGENSWRSTRFAQGQPNESGTLDLENLPESGAYSVFIDPGLLPVSQTPC